eukprot:TRINITY_DN6486_c0_g1_i1.p1 TRINITY_DN6486_c0_g1~~TRINITY_DN6486_c0_g1_i1.p1  ORF type:complete len:206 (-),score=64.48 TRINITY_DN6486_c0_g1_i1:164-745(-)
MGKKKAAGPGRAPLETEKKRKPSQIFQTIFNKWKTIPFRQTMVREIEELEDKEEPMKHILHALGATPGELPAFIKWWRDELTPEERLQIVNQRNLQIFTDSSEHSHGSRERKVLYELYESIVPTITDTERLTANNGVFFLAQFLTIYEQTIDELIREVHGLDVTNDSGHKNQKIHSLIDNEEDEDDAEEDEGR